MRWSLQLLDWMFTKLSILRAKPTLVKEIIFVPHHLAAARIAALETVNLGFGLIPWLNKLEYPCLKICESLIQRCFMCIEGKWIFRRDLKLLAQRYL
mmetsp:Transcript_4159/g.5663  ORF Transcript_4159/g.5663 Transcript_4159/m.5663 type:complete len:97 (-) Transcript_4159:1561-1851(-)